MKNISIYFVFSICTAFMLSCEKEIDYNGPSGDPRLVLNGIIEMDSTLKLHIERSVFFLANSSDGNVINDASVNLKNLSTNETYLLNESTAGLGDYEFPFTVTPNTSYSVTVTHSDFPSISAEMSTLSKIEILSVDTTSYEHQYGNRLKYEIKFNDPGAQENYYLLRINVTETNNWGGGENIYTYPIGLATQDPAVDNSENTSIDGSTYDVDYLTFKDATFNGTMKTLRVQSYFPYYGSSENTPNIEVQLVSMNKDTYLYFKSVNLYFQQDFFSEPVKVFSNILNGFGIFGFYNYSNYVL